MAWNKDRYKCYSSERIFYWTSGEDEKSEKQLDRNREVLSLHIAKNDIQAILRGNHALLYNTTVQAQQTSQKFCKKDRNPSFHETRMYVPVPQ